jgi:outer membrane protein assembly factor BamB
MNNSYRISLLVTCLLFQFNLVIYGQTLNIGIVEQNGAYSVGGLGISDFLTAESRSYTDFSSSFAAGTAPSLSGIDLLILGSFITNEANMMSTYQSMAGTLNTFVNNGGTVIMLCQADQDLATETWLESPRALTRADPDSNTAYPLQATHVLLTSPETLLSVDLTGWRVPSTSTSNRTGWEMFPSFTQGANVLGGDSIGSNGVLMEFGWGTGRALFYAMTLDKAYAVGNAVSKAGATKLMRNFLSYAEEVKAGSVGPIVFTPSGKYSYPIQGIVFMDTNKNDVMDGAETGRAGVGVSDGYDVVLTSATGYYVLPNAGQDVDFINVSQPSDTAKSTTTFYQFPSALDLSTTMFNFPLWPAAAGQSTTQTVFAQITDIHTTSEADRDLQLEGCQDIWDMDPAPDFIAATGDLVNTGSTISQYENYMPSVEQSPLPYFNVIGNHDRNSGTVSNYRAYLGPDYYSFDQGGVHFVARNIIQTSARQDTWLQNDLATLAPGKPIVLMQHYPPSTAQLQEMDTWGITVVFTGHWHSEKTVRSVTTTSVNTPSFVMGGIDCSPRGFRVVTINADGSWEDEWRYGGQHQTVNIVHPLENGNVGLATFPIIANVYDSSIQPKTVAWSLYQSSVERASGTLSQDTPINWSGVLDPGSGVFAGSAELRLAVIDVADNVWSVTSATFTIDPKAAAEPQTSGEWPMFMGSSLHSGNASATLAPPFRLAWTISTGADLDYSSPILGGGRLYVAMKRRNSNGVNGVMAINPTSGAVIWKVTTPHAINHTPAYYDGIVCIAEVGGRVRALSATTGGQIWQHDLLDNLGRYCYCAPAAEGGKFYVGTSYRFARLDAYTGAVDWERAVGGGSDWISSYASPAVSGSYLAMGGMWVSGSNDFVLLDKLSGNILWSHAAGNGMHCSPTFVGDRVLFTDRGSIMYCYQTSTNTFIWSRDMGSGWSATTPAVKDNVVVGGSANGYLYGINLINGAVLWAHTSGPAVFKNSPYMRDFSSLLSSPTICMDRVYFGSSDGYFYCLNLSTGSVIWSFKIGVPVLSTPLVSGNALFVSSNDGRIYAFTPEGEAAVPGAVPRTLDGVKDSNSVGLSEDATSGLSLHAYLDVDSLYLAVVDASSVIDNDDLVYIAFARQGVESRLTVPDDPGSNSDYIYFSGSSVVTVKPDEASGDGGGYLKFNKLDTPPTEFVDATAGLLGASGDTIEILMNRADNQLNTTTVFAWVVVVDPSSPTVIKSCVPSKVSFDEKVNNVGEMKSFDMNAEMTNWRERR